MNLIVVESPTKARTLSRFLGKDYFVEATVGHIKDLPKSKLGIDIERNFRPSYDIVSDKLKNINKIKKESKKVKSVFLATDPDREGEAIAAHVKEEIGNSKMKRIVFHEITKHAVRRALENPRDIDKNLVDAQIARRVLDRLVGYKLSPLLWKKVRRGLSAGRVQTVAVRLIVEREREIKDFKPQEYWEIFCTVKSSEKVGGYAGKDKSDFVVKLVKIGDKKADVKDGKAAKTIVTDLKKAKYSVFDVRKKEVNKHPYPPFITSTLTQAAARAYHWPAKRTMSIAQKLYEVGLITYHRTDSISLSKLALKMSRDYIKQEVGDEYLPEKAVIYRTKSKVAQEAHEAIRPTKVTVTKENFKTRRRITSDHRKLYDIIWRRFIASQMKPSVYDETRIDVLALRQAQGKRSEYLLRVSGQVMKFDGWRKIWQRSVKDESKEPILPEVSKGDPLLLVKVDPHQKFTEPPPRYGEASLVKTLESLGIGRPSTYAPIITTIQIRNYVEKIDRKFHSTPVGETVSSFLTKHFPDIFDYSFTAEMEDDLDNVAKGKRKWQLMMKDFYSPFEVKLEKVTEEAKRVKIATEKLGKKCPKCKKGELVVRIGRFGKFISCSRFPDCDHKEKYIEKIGVKCPDCGKGDVIIRQTKKGRKFYGCSRYPDCKWASWRKPRLAERKPSVAKKS